MATINYAFKEISCKIVYYGAGLCGKTTNLQYVHATVPGKFRGDLISLATEQDRTLFFDFLPLDLGEVKGFKTKFQLYTVPGQVYYNATRKLVLRGVDGVVFVVDSQKERYDENIESFKNLKENLKEYNYDLKNIPYVVQYNKRDLPNINTIQELQAAMNEDNAPYYEGVATTGVGVKETLKAISSLVLKKLSSEPDSALKGKPSTLAQVSQTIKPAAEDVFREAIPEKPAAPVPVKPAVQSESKTGPKPVLKAQNADISIDKPEPAKIIKPEAKPAAVAEKKPDTSSIKKPDSQVLNQKPKNAVTSQNLQTAEIPSKIHVSMKQPCNIYWRSIRIGSGNIELSNRSNLDAKGDYQITGIFKFFLFKRSFWTKLPDYLGIKEMNIQGEQVKFHHFQMEMNLTDDQMKIGNIYLDVQNKNSIYLEYPGYAGDIKIAPKGKKPIW